LCFQVLTSLLSFALRQLLSLVQNLRMVEVLSKYPAPDAPHTWDHVALPAPKPAYGVARAEDQEGLTAEFNRQTAKLAALQEAVAAAKLALAEEEASERDFMTLTDDIIQEVRFAERDACEGSHQPPVAYVTGIDCVFGSTYAIIEVRGRHYRKTSGLRRSQRTNPPVRASLPDLGHGEYCKVDLSSGLLLWLSERASCEQVGDLLINAGTAAPPINLSTDEIQELLSALPTDARARELAKK
jgi:hypothetical protein